MIRIRNLRMTYRGAHAQHAAVSGVSLDVEEGKFYTLLGPSGCGKTTTLRCVAGLERPDDGEIAIADELVCAPERGIWVDPHQRNIGMVFQSYAIWPHMSVFENVVFPLRYRRPRPSRSEMRHRAMQALALVRLDGLEDRPAPYLSGGQQQRLALARALVAEPRVLLLDEPLSNLDAKLREEMRLELREIVKRSKVTTLFVTHEQVEAITMSDVIAVMRDGVIVQQGTPAEIYGAPRQTFVADFIGRTNIVTGEIVALEACGTRRLARVRTKLGILQCAADSTMHAGEAVTLTVRPENVTLIPDGAPGDGDNIVAGMVESVVFLGNLLDCAVAVGGERVRVQLHPSTRIAAGQTVRLSLPSEHCLAMRP
jgi:iron(III) transport system ATP-binding protein